MPQNTTQKFFKPPRYLFRKYNILRRIKKLNIETFADIGCGAGELTCTLGKKGYSGLGIDFSKDALNTANHLRDSYGLNDSISFKLGGIEQLKKYDAIICCEVLEHIEDDEKFLKELLSHGDYFILSVPARMKYMDKFDEFAGHYRRYEKKDLIDMLERNSLEIISFDNYGFPFLNLNWHLRKVFSKKIESKKNKKENTKRSGINMLDMSRLSKVNIEPLINFLVFFTLPFNKYDLSEGYLVVCRKSAK